MTQFDGSIAHTAWLFSSVLTQSSFMPTKSTLHLSVLYLHREATELTVIVRLRSYARVK